MERSSGAHYTGSGCLVTLFRRQTEDMPCGESQHITLVPAEKPVDGGPSGYEPRGLKRPGPGSTSTARTQSLKDFKQLAQAKTMFLYSFPQS